MRGDAVRDASGVKQASRVCEGRKTNISASMGPNPHCATVCVFQIKPDCAERGEEERAQGLKRMCICCDEY